MRFLGVAAGFFGLVLRGEWMALLLVWVCVDEFSLFDTSRHRVVARGLGV